MSSPYDDAADPELRELLASAVEPLRAGSSLAPRAMSAERRRRRRLMVAVAAGAVLAMIGGAALAVTLPHARSGDSLRVADAQSPTPDTSPTSRSLSAPCGPERPGERGIGPTGGPPYLSAPSSPHPSTRVSRAQALRLVRGTFDGARLAKHSLALQIVRTGDLAHCEPTLAWIVYTGPSATDVPMVDAVNAACVEYVAVDANNIGAATDATECSPRSNGSCPATQAPPNTGPRPQPDPNRYAQLPTAAGRWQRLANSPLAHRSQPVVAWTGEQLLVWGGSSGARGATLHGDGAAYNPKTNTWTMLPPAPLSARVGAAAVWTGTELVIWGGYDDLSSARRLHVTGSGAAYSPQTGTWRKLPVAPLTAATNAGIAWTGTEVVIVDGQPAILTDRLRGYRQAAAYDPTSNRWRLLPKQPAGTPSAFNITVADWASDRLLVFHSYDGSGGPDAVTVDSYDPATNRWTHIRKCVGAGYVGAAYNSNGMVLVPPFYDAPGYLYTPDSNTWTGIAETPLPTTASALTGHGTLLGLTTSEVGHTIKPGDTALWNGHSNSWSKPQAMPVQPGMYPVMTGTDNAVLVWTDNPNTELLSFTS